MTFKCGNRGMIGPVDFTFNFQGPPAVPRVDTEEPNLRTVKIGNHSFLTSLYRTTPTTL